MPSLAEKILNYNLNLRFNLPLPSGYAVLNPYLHLPETKEVMERFYRKYYGDSATRKFIIGINPSRHGAGVTGVPFTDTKRLESACGIPMHSAHTHEISSVFMYDMIAALGGPASFYAKFYINSPFPLAIVKEGPNGQLVNANYYDDPQLFQAVKPFMLSAMEAHFALGLNRNEVYILGKKNADFILSLNREARWFEKAVVLDHPRYIQQYRSKYKEEYIARYASALLDAD
jgi:hypothetical protein